MLSTQNSVAATAKRSPSNMGSYLFVSLKVLAPIREIPMVGRGREVLAVDADLELLVVADVDVEGEGHAGDGYARRSSWRELN